MIIIFIMSITLSEMRHIVWCESCLRLIFSSYKMQNNAVWQKNAEKKKRIKMHNNAKNSE